MIELSFIIPAYNVEKYVERCLDSIYNQGVDEERFEVIVIDDGSMDNTLQILNCYAAKHSNIHIVSQVNQGPSAARNKGIDMSHGEYIWFVDADDYLAEKALSTLLPEMRKTECDILFFSVSVKNEDGHFFSQQLPKELCNQIMSGKEAIKQGFNIGSVWMGLWKVKFINTIHHRFLRGVNWGEDSLFVFSAVLQAYEIKLINAPLYIYERRLGTLTTAVSREKFMKQKMGDIEIAISLRSLAEQYRVKDTEICMLAESQFQKIVFGLVFSLFINKIQTKKHGTNREIICRMKQVELYPMKGYFNPWVKKIVCFILNHEFVIS